MIKVFRVGDEVQRSRELLQYSQNKHWLGKRGKVIKVYTDSCIVKWDHLEVPVEERAEFIDKPIWSLRNSI